MENSKMTTIIRTLTGLMAVLLLSGITVVMPDKARASDNPFTAKTFENVTSSAQQFEYQEEKVEVGTVYNFTVSNRDRSYAKEISLYISAKNRIESFKIYPGVDGTVLVIAEMDWSNFSIQTIKQIEIARDLSRKQTIDMSLTDNIYSFTVPEDNPYGITGTTIPTGHFPVANHGYDFSDLNFAFRHLVNSNSDVEVGILAPTPDTFAYTGKMRIAYEGEVLFNDKECNKYSLSGRGVADRTGMLLVNKAKGHFEYMELDANYHPAFDYFRYELFSVTKMTPQQWDGHVNARSAEYFKKNPSIIIEEKPSNQEDPT